MKKLLIVESPTKARTIGKYLGSDFEVVATVGHLRDLPKNKMGVDLAKDFEIDYVVDGEKKKVVDLMKKAAQQAEKIFIATDPDREGEAIAWHVLWILTNPGITNSKLQETNKHQTTNSKSQKKEISRISFHEITKEAVEEALKNQREVDMDLVNAQQGRRVLDRVVGYSLSPVLWKKVRRGLSAGRVQSVAVRLIAEREKEIEEFVREKYFKVSADLLGGDNSFLAELVRVDSKNVFSPTKINLFDGDYSYTKSIFRSRDEVEKLVGGLDKQYEVKSVDGREITRTPLPPYTTSKLQQAGARRFGWSGKQTMTLAQRLYEKGLITYHRTDSVYLADKAVESFRSYIKKTFGEEYLVAKPRVYKNTAKIAQEAHEAIRPTKVEITDPEGVDSKELKLYELIWKRAVGTQGAAAKMKNTTIIFTNPSGSNTVGIGEFKSIGVRMLFDGFLKISGEKHEDQILPEVKVGDKLSGKKVTIEEVETNPPPRYTDASLVASLEKQGIGRPSTYAPIISTIQLRQYVEKDEGKFRPTSLGKAANEFLVKNFEDILSLPFTAEMEADLDKVALGKLDWKVMMAKFWKPFEKKVKAVEETADRIKVETEKLGQKCPECGQGELVVRVGRYGKFVSCDRFPECKYTSPYKEMAGFKCPLCGQEAVARRSKAGRKFFGCSDYPKCKWAGWKKP